MGTSAGGHGQKERYFVGAWGVGDHSGHGIKVRADVAGVLVVDGQVDVSSERTHFDGGGDDGERAAEHLAHAVAAGDVPERRVLKWIPDRIGGVLHDLRQRVEIRHLLTAQEVYAAARSLTLPERLRLAALLLEEMTQPLCLPLAPQDLPGNSDVWADEDIRNFSAHCASRAPL